MRTPMTVPRMTRRYTCTRLGARSPEPEGREGHTGTDWGDSSTLGHLLPRHTHVEEAGVRRGDSHLQKRTQFQHHCKDLLERQSEPVRVRAQDIKFCREACLPNTEKAT